MKSALLSLRFDEGLTVREIADVLERPRSTVHFQLEQAVKSLRSKLVPSNERARHERRGAILDDRRRSSL